MIYRSRHSDEEVDAAVRRAWLRCRARKPQTAAARIIERALQADAESLQ